jgi:S1-C subfamily serine protease
MDEKHLVKLLWTAKAGLLAALVCMALGVVVDYLHFAAGLGPDMASGNQHTSNNQAGLVETRSASDYAAIATSNLFGRTDNMGNRQGVSPRSPALDAMASAQGLGLGLIGTVAGGPETSRAIIEDTQSNTTGVYRVGDTIALAPNNLEIKTGQSETPHPVAKSQARATVEAIHADTVVLRCENRSFVLRQHAGTAASNRSDPPRDNSQRAKDTSAAFTNPSNEQILPRPNRAEYVAEIFRRAVVEPYVKDDQTEGLRITGLENIPMAALFGLRNGDIVQSVDGQKLTSKQKAFQVLMKARTQSKVDLQLLRDGQTKNLSFNL